MGLTCSYWEFQKFHATDDELVNIYWEYPVDIIKSLEDNNIGYDVIRLRLTFWCTWPEVGATWIEDKILSEPVSEAYHIQQEYDVFNSSRALSKLNYVCRKIRWVVISWRSRWYSNNANLKGQSLSSINNSFRISKFTLNVWKIALP